MNDKNNSCWNETRSCQDDAFWYITRSYERSCWELEQNKDEFIFSPPRPHTFRIACGYLLHSLIFPHSLRIFKDFGMQIMNTAVKIFIFQQWVFFPIWKWPEVVSSAHMVQLYYNSNIWSVETDIIYQWRSTSSVFSKLFQVVQIVIMSGLHCGRNTHFRQIHFAVPIFNFKYIYIYIYTHTFKRQYGDN